MQTNFMTPLALATLMIVSGTTIAAAETCGAPAPNESGYGSRQLSVEECQRASTADPATTSGVVNPDGGATATNGMPTYGGFAPNVGPSAHDHPHGRRHW